MPLQATSGAASYDAFGGGAAAAPPTYIEDVFSTWLYTGTGAALTITNSIDLSTKGGLVWCKARSVGNHGRLFDTARGVQKAIYSSLTSGEATESTALTAFNADGFTLGSNDNINGSGATNVSWTFRKQPKFFDVVTYTGNGANRTISHALGAVPGCIIVKRTDTTAAWAVYHRSLANTQYLVLNTTAAADTGATWWNSTTPTSAVFSVGTDASVNASGGTYIAYIFAHDAGGFGLTGTDNVISCGSFTTNSSGFANVNLGYEPQWVMFKSSSSTTTGWEIYDQMRGWNTTGGTRKILIANTSAAETSADQTTYQFIPTSTGFTFDVNVAGYRDTTFIYIAIRRGPMKVPTTGTSVFAPAIRTGTSATANITSAGFPVDLALIGRRNTDGLVTAWDRLRGAPLRLITSNTNAESSTANGLTGFDSMTGFALGANNTVNDSTYNYVDWDFRRAPSFFDVVCYTGNGTAGRTVSHNLAAVPELIIGKTRDSAIKWTVYSAPVGNTAALFLNLTDTPETGSYFWNNTSPTSTNFTLGDSAINNNTVTAVAYLFATCAGVSKVGSYTGTATTKQIDCGFTAGARFVLIKRTDSTGDWYVWDTARGIVSGNDPYLLLNSTAAEVTNTDYIDTYSAGFEISSTAPAAINASGGTYIFLAIA